VIIKKPQTYVFKYLFDKRVYSGIRMMDKIVGKLTAKEVFFERVDGGGVFVYKIENDNPDNDIYFGDFYIATFDNMNYEAVWGVGSDIESALENAEREWKREKGDEYPNPFREALEKLKVREAFELANKDDNNILSNY